MEVGPGYRCTLVSETSGPCETRTEWRAELGTYPALERHREKALLSNVRIQQFGWGALRYKWYIEIQDQEEYLEYLEDPSRRARPKSLENHQGLID